MLIIFYNAVVIWWQSLAVRWLWGAEVWVEGNCGKIANWVGNVGSFLLC